MRKWKPTNTAEIHSEDRNLILHVFKACALSIHFTTSRKQSARGSCHTPDERDRGPVQSRGERGKERSNWREIKENSVTSWMWLERGK